MRRRYPVNIILKPDENFKVDTLFLENFKNQVEKTAIFIPSKNSVYMDFKKKMDKAKKI